MKKILLESLKILYPLIFIVLFLGYKGFIYQDIKAYIIRSFSDNSLGPNIDTIFMSLEIVLMLLIYMRLPSSIKNGYGIRKINLKEVLLLFLISFLVYIVAQRVLGYMYTLKYGSGVFRTMGDTIGEKVDIRKIYSYTNGDNFINTILLSSILEELVYRYFINLPFTSKVGKLYALIISSILFAFSHGPGRPIFWATLIDGLVSCLIFFYSKNILYSIIYHIFSNVIVTLFLLISVKFPIIELFIKGNELMAMVFELPISISITLVGIGAFAVILFFKTYTKKELLI